MAIVEPASFIKVITGPTASGKSALAMKQATLDREIEIVSADAFQIYREFDIGTAKPTQEERQLVRHHLIDILEPSQQYSAGQYARDARMAIEEILSRGKKPLVVGGTGLYIDALFFGISSAEIEPGAKQMARERYVSELERIGFEGLHKQLHAIDPELYAQIEREKNPIRLERAWTHYYATGIPLGEARKQKPDAFKYPPKFTLLIPERDDQRERVARRVDAMLQQGWLDEVRRLLRAGVMTNMPAMRAIGYKELAEVIEGKTNIEQAQIDIIHKTRQYAKRQITWMQRYVKLNSNV